jgi:hypothetical protein
MRRSVEVRMTYDNQFKSAAESQGFDEPLDESPIDPPEGWEGGEVQQTGGWILNRIWYDDGPSDAKVQLRVAYGQDPHVSAAVYRFEKRRGYREFKEHPITREADENTDEAKAEVAKEIMEEIDLSEYDRSEVEWL